VKGLRWKRVDGECPCQYIRAGLTALLHIRTGLVLCVSYYLYNCTIYYSVIVPYVQQTSSYNHYTPPLYTYIPPPIPPPRLPFLGLLRSSPSQPPLQPSPLPSHLQLLQLLSYFPLFDSLLPVPSRPCTGPLPLYPLRQSSQLNLPRSRSLTINYTTLLYSLIPRPATFPILNWRLQSKADASSSSLDSLL
jgi:hypothetical protein